MKSDARGEFQTKTLVFLTKTCICSLLLLSLFFILQCTIRKPTAPSWNTKLTIPLLSKHYDMATLIEKIDDPHLQIDSLGNPYFCLDEELDTIKIREHLSLSPVSKNLNDTLGTIELSPSGATKDTVKLAQIYPWSAGALPDTAFDVLLQVETIESFAQATVQSGTTTLRVENSLGMNFDSLTIDLMDSVSSSVVATFVFPNGISDAHTDSQTTGLIPQTISNQLYYNIRAHTPGGTIFTASDKYLSLRLSVNNVVASQGMARIPSIPLEKNDTLGFTPSDVVIDSATIDSGNILLHLNNFSNLNARVQVKLPDFEREGQALTINRNVVANGTNNVNVQLDGYDFIPQIEQALRVEVRALVESSGVELVAFRSSDSIRLDASSSEIIFSRISGRIPQTEVRIDTIGKNLDLPEGFQNVQLTNALLEVEISNGLDLPADFSILIRGDNQRELNLIGHVESGSATNPARATIINADLSQFLSPIPGNIVITGTALCGQETNRATITKNDFVFTKLRIVSPLQFVMGPTDVQIESTSHELTNEVRDLLTGHLNWGKITLDANNHLPLGASIELYVSANEEHLFTNPDLTIGPISVSGGVIGQDGLVEDPVISNSVTELSSQDLQIFKNRPFYIGGKLNFPGTKEEEVKAVGSDYLDVTAYLELEIKNDND